MKTEGGRIIARLFFRLFFGGFILDDHLAGNVGIYVMLISNLFALFAGYMRIVVRLTRLEIHLFEMLGPNVVINRRSEKLD